MTKKHFDLIARNFNERITHAVSDKERHVASQIAREQAIIFGQLNPRFDQRKFLDACGIVR